MRWKDSFQGCTKVWAVLTGRSIVSGFDLAWFSFLSSELLRVFTLHGGKFIFKNFFVYIFLFTF